MTSDDMKHGGIREVAVENTSDMSRTVDLLAEHPFLSGVPREWLERLSSHGHPSVRQAGRRLFHEGRAAEHFWLIRSGLVALDITDARRGDVVVDHIAAGGVLGWSWLFPPYRWHFGAVAVELTQTVEFDAAGIRRLIADDAALGRDLTMRFMSIVVDRLQTTRRRAFEP
jgi:CRP/FNR family transcriptional regulator, cyclic AMP receptor protein